MTKCRKGRERMKRERDKGRREFLTHLLHDVWREDSRSEGPAENVGEFLVQASDAHLLEVPLWVDDRLSSLLGLRLTCDLQKVTD